MPFSFQPYGIFAILVMVGVVTVNELIKYLRKQHP
jgi:hypothetical protein